MSSQLPSGQEVKEQYFKGTVTSDDDWFLDLFSSVALGGYDFPIATYCDSDLASLVASAINLLNKEEVDAIRISRTTRGQAIIDLRK